jgi:hypoxanthine phosphoribosyltransferase
MIINNKKFKKLISYKKIQSRLIQISNEINKTYKNKNPLFIAVLDGSFIFAADLYKKISIKSEISFVKLKSYNKTKSEKIKKHIGICAEIKNRHIIILEDIVDTGKTMKSFLRDLKKQNPKSIKIAALLSKPETHDIKIDYVGFEIENKFVVGFGLDYDGLGRNSNDILQIC